MFKWLLGPLGGFLSGIWGYVAAALAAVAGIAAVYLKGQSAGKTQAQAERLKKEAENVQTANEIERKVDTAKPGAAADELRRRWNRD